MQDVIRCCYGNTDQTNLFEKYVQVSSLVLASSDSEVTAVLMLNGVVTGLPSSVCVVGCVFVAAVSVYQISKTKTEIWEF